MWGWGCTWSNKKCNSGSALSCFSVAALWDKLERKELVYTFDSHLRGGGTLKHESHDDNSKVCQSMCQLWLVSFVPIIRVEPPMVLGLHSALTRQRH